jgi:hypothetical protein
MTHNTVAVPIERLQLPAFVEYDGRIYRAWHKLPLVKPGGVVLDATDTNLVRHALLYACEDAMVLKVVG